MMRRFVGNTIETPEARAQKCRFGREMDGYIRQLTAQSIFNRQLAYNGNGVLIKRNVDIVRGGTRHLQAAHHIPQHLLT
jgi:hypothetical protein